MCVNTWSNNRVYGHIDNIRLWMENATIDDWKQGLKWYPDANEFVETVVRETGIDKRIVSAVLSALSPQNPWDRNKQDCKSLVQHYANGGSYDDAPPVCTFNNNKRKAWTFLTGHDWNNGNKTSAFVQNISFPLTSRDVTVDIWAVRVWLNNSEFGCKCEECSTDKTVKHGPSLTDKDYRQIEHAYQTVADEYGLIPSQAQAICWVAMKNAVGR